MAKKHIIKNPFPSKNEKTPPEEIKDVPGTEDKPKKFLYSLDSPKFELLDDRRITVEGWLLPMEEQKVYSLRIRNNGRLFDLPYGIGRTDVSRVFPEIDPGVAAKSGFSLDLEFEDGFLDIEADLGEGFENVHSLHLKYSGEKPLSSNYNPHLAGSWAEHVDLLEAKSKYFFEKETERKFERGASDPKLIAFYLPQFHPIPENDAVWGKGFTEWTNVTTAQPRFIGHHQPILPRDLGYYDLRLEENIADQISLAKQHGIYGFCFYYYWFSGRQILEKPLLSFLKHREWDFNFMICWANENWTKRWDGKDKDVIIAQKYLREDPLNFIKDVESILLDSRYIRIDNKPVLAVYRPEDFKKPADYVDVWRNYFRKKHKLELHLVSVLSFKNEDPAKYGFDAAIDFVPQGIHFRGHTFKDNSTPRVDIDKRLLDIRFEGTANDYRAVVQNEKFHQEEYDFNTYKCVMPSWDNDARKKGKGTAFYYANPDLYAKWLDRIVSETSYEKSLIFVNAWNEWAEGTTLEPSLHYGHALLNRTAEVLAKYSKKAVNRRNFSPYSIDKKKTTDLAVIIHLYYPEQWNYLRSKLTNIDQVVWDLFVTLQSKDESFVRIIKKSYPRANVYLVPNRGRDILPFVHLARRLEQAGYKAVLKLHTKKSKHRKDGAKWFEELVSNVLPNKLVTRKLTSLVLTRSVLIGPKGHYISLKTYMGSNERTLRGLLARLYDDDTARKVLETTEEQAYFGGSMFWASMDAIKPILDLYLMPEDFEAEIGQIDGTMAHAVERLIGIVPALNGNSIYISSRLSVKKVEASKSSTAYKYVG